MSARFNGDPRETMRDAISQEFKALEARVEAVEDDEAKPTSSSADSI